MVNTETFANWVVCHFNNFICGFIIAFFASLINYFSPILHIELVMIIAIILDFILGLWASYKRGIGWKSHKLWNTIYKLGFAPILVMLLFAMDNEMGFSFIQLHLIAAWFITGFEIWSILENMTYISDHKVFRLLKKLMRDKIEKKTGIDLDEN